MKGWGVLLVVGVFCLLLGAGIGYWWVSEKQPVTEEFEVEEQPTRVATLDLAINNSAFANFSTVIDANGSVSTETSKSATITIWNNDTEDSLPLIISMYNTINGKEGLPDALQNIDGLDIKLTYQNGIATVTKYLVKDGEIQTKGISIGSLEQDAYTQITLTVTVGECTNEYVDGASYTCTVYVIQGNSYDDIDFTFTT